uniref:Uncharacterized protein n=1 Tax=Anguilla anguilla TaxID=7936 RepID=A0A0E9PBW0_ANGAN
MKMVLHMYIQMFPSPMKGSLSLLKTQKCTEL